MEGSIGRADTLWAFEAFREVGCQLSHSEVAEDKSVLPPYVPEPAPDFDLSLRDHKLP